MSVCTATEPANITMVVTPALFSRVITGGTAACNASDSIGTVPVAATLPPNLRKASTKSASSIEPSETTPILRVWPATVVTTELGLLADQLLAQHLGGVDGGCVVVGRAPQVRRLLGRVRVRRRVALHEDVRRRQSGLEDLEVLTADQIHHRERLHRLDRHDVGALGRLVGAAGGVEVRLQVTAPRLVEAKLGNEVVVETVLVRARRVRSPIHRLHRVALELLLVGEHEHDLDPVLGDARRGGAAVVGAFLPRLHARGAAAHRRAVEATVRTVRRVVVTAAGVVERGLGAHPRRRDRRAGTRPGAPRWPRPCPRHCPAARARSPARDPRASPTRGARSSVVSVACCSPRRSDCSDRFSNGAGQSSAKLPARSLRLSLRCPELSSSAARRRRISAGSSSTGRSPGRGARSKPV